MSHESKNMTRGKKNERCSSFVSCRKEKKKEKIKIINNKTKKNETKQNRGRRKRSFLSYFFPPVWNVNLERDNRMRKILRRRVRFSCACTRLSCSSLSRGIWLRDRRQKKKIRTNVFVCHFPSLFFFSLSFRSRVTARRLRDTVCVCRVSRVRDPGNSCVVLRYYAWEREGVNIIINNVI